MNRIEAVIGGMKMIRNLTWPEAKAQGEREAKKAIRKAVLPMLKNLRTLTEWRCRNLGAPCGTCGACCTKLCLDRIDAATKPPKRGSR